MVCQHRIEVEVWPGSAEVYYRDERYADPLNTQVMFSAAVYNARTSKVIWQVTDLNGGPGTGTIDAAGLYTAPLKGSLPYTLTDIVVAASADDPMRKAYARVAVIGPGPELKPAPKIDIYPKKATIYYPDNNSGQVNNEHMDASNKVQFFRASIRNAPGEKVDWLVDGAVKKSGCDTWYLFDLAKEGYHLGSNGKTVKVAVRLQSDHNVLDEAIAVLENYSWPELNLTTYAPAL